MADAYWNRQQQQFPPSSGLLKRPRPDYETSASSQLFVHDDDRGRFKVVQDTKSIGSAYDRYLKSAQLSASLNMGEAAMFVAGPGAISGYPVADPTSMYRTGHLGSDISQNGLNTGFAGQRPTEMMSMSGREPVNLPQDASSTLYVEGLPTDCIRREVAHIFRPFVGYKEVRLVNKESKHRSGEPLVFCFVDFTDPACAATAMTALQGYKMDEDDKDSTYLRLQFARNIGPRSGSRPHGRR